MAADLSDSSWYQQEAHARARAEALARLAAGEETGGLRGRIGGWLIALGAWLQGADAR